MLQTPWVCVWGKSPAPVGAVGRGRITFRLLVFGFSSMKDGVSSKADSRSERIKAGLPPDHALDMVGIPITAQTIPPRAVSLPPITGSYPTDSALFVCCDSDYFRNFGIVLLRSVAENSPGLRVHIHLMNPAESLMGFIAPLNLAVTLTHETCPKNKIYYHAARLARFADALDICAGSLLMTDTDALVTGDIRPIISGALSLRVRPGRVSDSEHFSACFLRGDKSSRPYFQRASEIMQAHLSAPWWGLDQYALYAAWTEQRPHMELIGPDTASVDADEPGLFWFTAGQNKRTLLTDSTPYARLFQRYINA